MICAQSHSNFFTQGNNSVIFHAQGPTKQTDHNWITHRQHTSEPTALYQTIQKRGAHRRSAAVRLSFLTADFINNSKLTTADPTVSPLPINCSTQSFAHFPIICDFFLLPKPYSFDKRNNPQVQSHILMFQPTAASRRTSFQPLRQAVGYSLLRAQVTFSCTQYVETRSGDRLLCKYKSMASFPKFGVYF